MFSFAILSAALLATTALAAPTPTTVTARRATTILLPLYANGVDISKTSYMRSQNDPPSAPSATPPNVFTHIESSTNVTIVRQEAAVPLFRIPSSDLQLFADFANASYIRQASGHQDSDALYEARVDIGAKLVGEEGGDHTVHVTVVRDPVKAKSPFTWGEGGVVVRALEEWSRLWAEGSFAGCAGVLVQVGDHCIAQGNFCGESS